MNEHYANFEAFNVLAAGEALAANPRPTHDVAHGDGDALTVHTTEVEVYPAVGAARITTPDARIELFRVPRYAVGGDRLVFFQGEDRDDTSLSVTAEGIVLFGPTQDTVESPQTRESAPSGSLELRGSNTPSKTHTESAAPDRGSPEAQELPQVQLRGRLGRDPWYSDQGEQPTGGFPLAVNDERSGTTWHRVVLFDRAAEALHEAHAKGQIRKGRLVDVVGNEVERQEPRPNGGVKKSKEFHATSVARVTSTPRRS